jgi:hypothetical protein
MSLIKRIILNLEGEGEIGRKNIRKKRKKK